MIEKPMDILSLYPVRKSRKQKQAFRQDVMEYAKSMGYEVCEEKGSFGSRNLVIGDPGKAKDLITAHYDTCARLPFPNLITPCSFWGFLGYQLFTLVIMFGLLAMVGFGVHLASGNFELAYMTSYVCLWLLLLVMLIGPANPVNANDNTSGVVAILDLMRNLPEDQRDEICFVLFDLEETGLMGSSSYASKHKEQIPNQMVWNLDCIGDGEEIWVFPTKKLRKDETRLSRVRHFCTDSEKKPVVLREKGFSVYPSDQSNFPYAVGIAAFHRNRYGMLYLSKIHTPKDTCLDEENVSILCSRLKNLLTGNTVQ